MFPSKQDVTICFAHAAYQMKARFDLRKTGIKSFQVWAYDELQKRVGEADVVVGLGHVEERADPGGRQAQVHPVDQLGHGPVFQGAARGQAGAAVQRRRRQCPRRGRARDLADPGGGAAAARGARQSAQEDVARHDRRSHPARGRARRQDAAGGRHGPHRRPSRQARQGVRHEGDRHPPRSQAGHQRRRLRSTAWPTW